MDKLIRPDAFAVSRNTLIRDAVAEMIRRKTSCILVHDVDGALVGIVTERDIVRRFTLATVEDKLALTVGTIMSAPVECVRYDHLREDVARLHLDHKLRHFPVVHGNGRRIEDVMGMVTVTDVCREYLELERRAKRRAI